MNPLNREYDERSIVSISKPYSAEGTQFTAIVPEKQSHCSLEHASTGWGQMLKGVPLSLSFPSLVPSDGGTDYCAQKYKLLAFRQLLKLS